MVLFIGGEYSWRDALLEQRADKRLEYSQG